MAYVAFDVPLPDEEIWYCLDCLIVTFAFHCIIQLYVKARWPMCICILMLESSCAQSIHFAWISPIMIQDLDSMKVTWFYFRAVSGSFSCIRHHEREGIP